MCGGAAQCSIGAVDDDDRSGGRPEDRIEALEIKLSELEFGQGQLDDVVRRQGEDIRRLTEAVHALGTRLEAALGGSGPMPGGAATGGAGASDTDPEAVGAPASPTVDPERPPHYSGPA